MALLPQEHAQRVTPDRRLLVPVPWELALTLRERLLERGIKSVARFDPEGRQARLELLHHADPRLVRRLLKTGPK
jgi:hypothetical protein